MKFTKCSPEKAANLRKSSAKRMTRPEKFEKWDKGRAFMHSFYRRAGIVL